jgi:hypothetical protein
MKLECIGSSQLMQFCAFQLVFHVAACLLALYLIEANLLLLPGNADCALCFKQNRLQVHFRLFSGW